MGRRSKIKGQFAIGSEEKDNGCGLPFAPKSYASLFNHPLEGGENLKQNNTT